MIIIGNGRLITRDKNQPYFENGGVVLEGKLIKALGETKDLLASYPDAQFIDVNRQLIMPAFINTHNHIYSAFARGLTINSHPPKGFLDILEGLWWNIDRHMNLQDCQYSAEATFINCIENGVTTVFDHHASYKQTQGSLRVLADVAKTYGIRSCLSYEISDRHGEEQMKEAVLENERFINYANQDDSDMLKGIMGLHASFTLSDETLLYCKEHTPHGSGYHIHIAEGIEDEYDSMQKYNCRTVERLAKQGILGDKTIAGHCIHVNDEEMDILKASHTAVIHNPESNMGNAVGAPDVIKMYEKGILLGLGTDGYTNDMLESYKVANCLQKHTHQDPSVAWTEIPAMLFENNAIIANRFFKTPLGKLKEGYSADVIVVDYTPLTPMNEGNVNSHILFGVNGSMVTTTIGNGKILMKDRNLIDIDKREVLASCQEQAADLWKRIHASEEKL